MILADDGRVVPVYAVTGGRTRAGDHDLPIESVVTSAAQDGSTDDLQPEYRAILDLARSPVALVEVAAGLGVPIGVARVLVSDLAEAGHLVRPHPGVRGRPARRRSSPGSWMAFVPAELIPLEDPRRGRLRRRQDDAGRRGLRDPAAAHRGDA